ncbi:hypothetical protein MRI28_08345 [Nocardiopsis dassonvillei]|nr:hypothetical protein [Nocardiopsis dassonvillei]MCK9869663.1 hypothetical protein [Nocardiopsis dassonvillei]
MSRARISTAESGWADLLAGAVPPPARAPGRTLLLIHILRRRRTYAG